MVLQNDPPNRARRCFREPIPEIAIAARYLDEAVSAHLADEPELAGQLIQRADMPQVREWLESIWGAKSPYTQYRVVENAPSPMVPENQRDPRKHPTSAQEKQLHLWDGYNCRFCGIPVIRKKIRERLKELYPLITCAACNYGRMQYTLEEVGLADPRTREPVRSSWDGLERLLLTRKSKSK